MTVIYERREDLVISELFDALNRLECGLEDIVRVIPAMTDEQINEGIALTCRLEERAFLLRGALTLEKRNRAMRLVGGRAQKAAPGEGMREAAKYVGKLIGSATSTVETDARIVETFFKNYVPGSDSLSEETRTDDGESLPREFYAVALRAEDPHAAIEIAREKRDDPELGSRYTSRQFSEDVKALNRGEEPGDIEHKHWVNIGLNKEAREALRSLTVRWGTDQEGAITKALLTCVHGYDGEFNDALRSPIG